jgi:hypothetical protein
MDSIFYLVQHFITDEKAVRSPGSKRANCWEFFSDSGGPGGLSVGI